MKTACVDQAVTVIPVKALRLGLSSWSFRVLAELFTVRETEDLRCATFNDLDWKCFLPLANHTKKALAELEQLQGLLKPIIYIDLIDLSEQNAEWALLNGLKPSGEPAQPPKFPANQESRYLSPSFLEGGTR